MQVALREACRQDILFWINTFVWAFNARKSTGMGTIVPFVTFPLQDDVILGLHDIMNMIEPMDAVIRKSRYMGASYILLLLFLHDWMLNDEMNEYMVMSRKEDLVDGDNDSLFGKVDITLRHQPSWLLPEGFRQSKHRQKMRLLNPKTHSILKGWSTTSASGVGGRYKGMMFDEFGLVDQARSLAEQSEACSDHRFYNSTPKGVHTKFHDLTLQADAGDPNLRIFRMHWSEHPWFNVGLWLGDDGRKWSPWKVVACGRLGWSPSAIGSELEMEDISAGQIYFNEDVIDALIHRHTREPNRVGNWDFEQNKFVESPGGTLQLWFDGDPPIGKYGIGCDVASGVRGTKATPSCMSIVNLRTGEKVGEYQNTYRRPEEFAADVYHVAMWFGEAVINFENAGPGNTFRDTLIESFHYRNFRLGKKAEKTLVPGVTMQIGFGVSPEGKLALLDSYRNGLTTGRFLNPSKRALEECLQFVYDKGWVKHASELDRTERVGVGANHGDQVIADALAYQIVKEAGLEPKPGGKRREPPTRTEEWAAMAFTGEDDILDW